MYWPTVYIVATEHSLGGGHMLFILFLLVCRREGKPEHEAEKTGRHKRHLRRAYIS